MSETNNSFPKTTGDQPGATDPTTIDTTGLHEFWTDPESLDPETYEKARTAFEVDNPDPDTFLGILYKNPPHEIVEKSGITPKEVELGRMQDALLHAKRIMEPFRIAAAVTGDVVENSRDASRTALSVIQGFDPHEEPTPEGLLRRRTVTDRLTILSILSGNKQLIRLTDDRTLTAPHPAGVEFTDAQKVEYEDTLRQRHRLLLSARTNPSPERKKLQKQLRLITSGELDGIAPQLAYSEEPLPQTQEYPKLDADELLDVTFLPPDTDLRELSETIHSESTDREKAFVDPRRIEVLEMMRQMHGTENCIIARGKPRSEREFKADDGSVIGEDYIVLAMKQPDGTEDALAISPIGGLHAAFFTRQGASEGLNWRELFALTKKDAQYFGVRRLQFKGNDQLDPYEAMTEKLIALATCKPEDFNDGMRFNEETRQYELRKPRIRHALLAAAIDGATYSNPNDSSN